MDSILLFRDHLELREVNIKTILIPNSLISILTVVYTDYTASGKSVMHCIINFVCLYDVDLPPSH